MKFDVIIIGGDHNDAAEGLRYIAEGKTACLIAKGGLIGAPPTARAEFAHKGTLLCSDEVASVEYKADGSVQSIETVNLKGTKLTADLYVLAAGRFVSGGLRSDMDKVWEPVFGADVEYEADPEQWCDEDFFAPQPFEKFGVLTSPDGHVLKGGRPVANLMAFGEIIAKK